MVLQIWNTEWDIACATYYAERVPIGSVGYDAHKLCVIMLLQTNNNRMHTLRVAGAFVLPLQVETLRSQNTWALCGCKRNPCTGARRRLRRVQAFGGDVQDEALRGRGHFRRQPLVRLP